MKFKLGLLSVIFLVFLKSCNTKVKQTTVEETILQKMITTLQEKDSSLIISNYQGSFSIFSTASDTSDLYYSGFWLGSLLKVDTTKMFSNVQFNKDTNGLCMNDKLIPVELSEMKKVDYLKNFISKKDSLDNAYLFDWNKFNEDGYSSFQTISQVMYDSLNKAYLIGIQTYSDKDFKLNVMYFDVNDNLSISDIWSKNLIILDYKCIFDDDCLKSISPNSMIAESEGSHINLGN
jgi:hypothetical protein